MRTQGLTAEAVEARLRNENAAYLIDSLITHALSWEGVTGYTYLADPSRCQVRWGPVALNVSLNVTPDRWVIELGSPLLTVEAGSEVEQAIDSIRAFVSDWKAIHDEIASHA